MQLATSDIMLWKIGPAALALGIKVEELERMVKAGSVPTVTLPGGVVRFSPEGLRRWVEAQQRQPVA